MKLAVQVHPDASLIATYSHMFLSTHSILLELKYKPGFLSHFLSKPKCQHCSRKPLHLPCYLPKELSVPFLIVTVDRVDGET